MLDTVDIEGLKGVGKVELKFDPDHRVRVLFGVNGVGKTKTLEAIYLGMLFTQSEFYAAMRSSWIEGKKHTPASSVSIDGVHVLGRYIGDSTHQALSDAVPLGPQHSGPVVFIGAGGRASVAAEPSDAGPLGQFSERKKRHFERLLAEFLSGNLRSAGMAVDVRAWFVQRAQSVNPYQVEKDNLQNEIDTVLELLNEIDPRVAAGKLQIDGAQRVFLNVSGDWVELGELSSGFASVVKIFQAIVAAYSNFTNAPDVRRMPGVVLIDEVESHLHINWQTTIVGKLKRLFPKTVFVVATHSPLILSQLEEGEAYLLARDEDDLVRATIINSPNMKAFGDVLNDAFGVDLNGLKRAALESTDQSAAKKRLLDLLLGEGEE